MNQYCLGPVIARLETAKMTGAVADLDILATTMTSPKSILSIICVESIMMRSYKLTTV